MKRRDFILSCGIGMASVALGTWTGCSGGDSAGDIRAETLARLQRQIREAVQSGDLRAARQTLDKLSSLAFSVATYQSNTVAAFSCALVFDAMLQNGSEADATAVASVMSEHFSATPPNDRNGVRLHNKAKLLIGSELMLRYAALGNGELVEAMHGSIRGLIGEEELGPNTREVSWGYMDDVARALYMVGRHTEALDLVSEIPEEYPQRIGGYQDLARQAALDAGPQPAFEILDRYVPDPGDRFVALTYFNRVRPLIARSLIETGRIAEAVQALERAESTADGFIEATRLDICKKRNGYYKLSGLYGAAGDATKARETRDKAESLSLGC